MKAFLNYYKWHIFFFMLFAVCVLTFTITSCRKSEPDLVINCISPEYINVQNFNDRKSYLEALLQDADGDDKKIISLVNYTYDTQNNLDEVMELLGNSNDSDIIITTSSTLAEFEDKSILVDMRNIISDADLEKYETLKDDTGKVYAVSLSDNDYITDMGFFNTSDLYITVVDDEEDASKRSAKKKNARNITLAIVKEYNI